VEDGRGYVALAVCASARLSPSTIAATATVGAVVIPTVGRNPSEVGLEDLAQVHPARDAKRIEDHVDRGAVLEERHVLLVHDLRDHSLVAVTARKLVAFGDLALLG